MQSFHLKTTVGGDGVLRVPLPPEYQNQELEAIVLWELLPKSELANPPQASGWQPGFFEEVVGGWVGEPLGREDQGESEVRENLF